MRYLITTGYLLYPRCLIPRGTIGRCEWPDMLGTAHVGMSGQVPQQPKCRPQSTHIMPPRHGHLGFQYPPGDTKLIPRLQHGRSEMFPYVRPLQFHVIKPDNVRVSRLTRNDQFPLFVGPHILGGVVVQSIVRIVVLVHGRPAGIGPVVKFPMRHVEFVGKDQFVEPFGIVRGISGWGGGG